MYQPQLEHLWNNARRYIGQPAPSAAHTPPWPRTTLLFAAGPPPPAELDDDLAAEDLEASELAESERERGSQDQVDAEAYSGRRHETFTDEDDDDGVLRRDVGVLPEETNGVVRTVDRVIRNNDPSV